MASIEQFIIPATGYYDEGAILQAAGVAEREARFADIFGDAQGSHDIAAEYQALLDEARRRNAEMLAAAQTTNAAAIATAFAANDWPTLVRLGAARVYRDEDRMVYELTVGVPGAVEGDYADQVGIDDGTH